MSIKQREAIAGAPRNILNSKNLIDRMHRELTLEADKINHHLSRRDPRHFQKFKAALVKLQSSLHYLQDAATELELEQCDNQTT